MLGGDDVDLFSAEPGRPMTGGTVFGSSEWNNCAVPDGSVEAWLASGSFGRWLADGGRELADGRSTFSASTFADAGREFVAVANVGASLLAGDSTFGFAEDGREPGSVVSTEGCADAGRELTVGRSELSASGFVDAGRADDGREFDAVVGFGASLVMGVSMLAFADGGLEPGRTESAERRADGGREPDELMVEGTSVGSSLIRAAADGGLEFMVGAACCWVMERTSDFSAEAGREVRGAPVVADDGRRMTSCGDSQ